MHWNMDAGKKFHKIYFELFGVLYIFLCVQVELHRYLELNADYTNTAPYVLVGTGALILFIGTLACCCTVKGQPALLYMVNYSLLNIVIGNY